MDPELMIYTERRLFDIAASLYPLLPHGNSITAEDFRDVITRYFFRLVGWNEYIIREMDPEAGKKPHLKDEIDRTLTAYEIELRNHYTAGNA